MDLSRRALIGSMGAVSAALPLAAKAVPSLSLPDKSNYDFHGTFLNAAYAHPLNRIVRKAGNDFLLSRADKDVTRAWPRDNPRNAAVAKFAALINADPADIAVVPSTMEGENHVAAALGLSAAAGVVTDIYHYDASLAMYGELAKQGVPVTCLRAKENRIPLEDVERAITGQTKLVAVSHVASDTGHQYDLKALCDVAHKKGALVYADIVQSAGAIPLDVKASGVDFACSGAYKWLMGEFGAAFLYVRPDRLSQLKRTAVGWRSLSGNHSHAYPFDPPGPALGDWTTRDNAAGLFEVSTPSWVSLAMLAVSIDHVMGIGIANIAAHRKALIARLRDELPRRGFAPMTAPETEGPIITFAYQDAQKKLEPVLLAANIKVTLGDNRMRVSPSVYNDMGDIEKLLRALPKA
ncbi:MAG: aminotransferase class V-fold PLP-dependent enzyme [Rhizomicrobium sp.]